MKYLIAILITFSITACASVNYQAPDGTNITYKRLMSTTDKITLKFPDGSTAEITGQNYNVDVVRAATEGATKGVAAALAR